MLDPRDKSGIAMGGKWRNVRWGLLIGDVQSQRPHRPASIIIVLRILAPFNGHERRCWRSAGPGAGRQSTACRAE